MQTTASDGVDEMRDARRYVSCVVRRHSQQEFRGGVWVLVQLRRVILGSVPWSHLDVGEQRMKTFRSEVKVGDSAYTPKPQVFDCVRIKNITATLPYHSVFLILSHNKK